MFLHNLLHLIIFIYYKIQHFTSSISQRLAFATFYCHKTFYYTFYFVSAYFTNYLLGFSLILSHLCYLAPTTLCLQKITLCHLTRRSGQVASSRTAHCAVSGSSPTGVLVRPTQPSTLQREENEYVPSGAESEINCL